MLIKVLHFTVQPLYDLLRRLIQMIAGDQVIRPFLKAHGKQNITQPALRLDPQTVEIELSQIFPYRHRV